MIQTKANGWEASSLQRLALPLSVKLVFIKMNWLMTLHMIFLYQLNSFSKIIQQTRDKATWQFLFLFFLFSFPLLHEPINNLLLDFLRGRNKKRDNDSWLVDSMTHHLPLKSNSKCGVLNIYYGTWGNWAFLQGNEENIFNVMNSREKENM